MRAISLLFVPFLTGHALAQIATITKYVTVPPAASSTLPSSEQVKQVTPDTASTTAQQTTFATSASSAFSSASTAYSAAQVPSTLSPAASSQTSSDTSAYNGGSSGSGSDVNTDAGASGSGSSFSISKGGLIAVIVVVVIVALFGIASTILFVVAKRRQWNVRASIRRVSRRLTGRAGAPPTPRTPGRNNRRTTVNAGRMASSRVDTRSAKHPGYKAGSAAVMEERDAEKGALGKGAPADKRQRGGAWQKLWGNDWK
ncbi:hypothetical protein B0A55_01058 [Friedmanniomyces simplex]|uniref:Mid2 domain-containing protein n=1 Tax=Friedmanniomyces simplex TaxID=329884 RepID=A0A4U0Y5F4_9PEZI|nr:hypothetical protein B0A55_01058 [Friedmanniomyces simplex]